MGCATSYSVEKSIRLDLDEWEEYLINLAPEDEKSIRKRSLFPVLIKYGKRNCQELFDDLGFKNHRLLYFLYELFVGRDFSAIGFIVMFGWFHAKNAGYLLGGSSAMTQRMAEKFTSLA